MYIGVDDRGKVVGIKRDQKTKKLLETLPNKILNYLGVAADVNQRNQGALSFIEISVKPSSVPVSYRGEYYYRTGSTKQKLSGIALMNFIIQKTGVRWEDGIVEDVSVRDLDEESFKVFKKRALHSQRMTPYELEVSNEELLNKLKLTIDGKLTRAAVLLFHEDPEIVQVGSQVRVAKFAAHGSPEIEYQEPVSGSLIVTANKVVDLIYSKYLKAAITFEDDKRVETFPFAREAVREAIYNAIAHNCYIYGIPIQIRIDEEELIISNSCVLPKGWTVRTLMKVHSSIPYNPKIANVFYRAGFIENWGRGIEKMCNACKELGAKPPKYNLLGMTLRTVFNAVQIRDKGYFSKTELLKGPNEVDGDDHKNNTIGHKKGETDHKKSEIDHKNDCEGKDGVDSADKPYARSELELIIISLMTERNNITIAEIASKINVSFKTTQRIIDSMKKSGRITRIGGKRGGYWNVNKNGE